MNLQLLLLCQVLVKHNVVRSVNTAYPFASLTPLFNKQQYFLYCIGRQTFTSFEKAPPQRRTSNGVEYLPTFNTLNVRHRRQNSTRYSEKYRFLTENKLLFIPTNTEKQGFLNQVSFRFGCVFGSRRKILAERRRSGSAFSK